MHMSVTESVGKGGVVSGLKTAGEIGLLLIAGYYVGFGVATIISKFVPQLAPFVDFVVIALGVVGAAFFMHKGQHMLAALSGGAAIYSTTKVLDRWIGPTISGAVMQVSDAVA